MLKIDYILLARHFREETSEQENYQINIWRDESITNTLTYKRLQRVGEKEINPIIEVISKEETIVWKKIITKILAEEVENR
ncbi:MAG: hypothetical protein U5N85_15360 [Arcicella sp.]|nr:hypothetical protein [Arcicella sp.]